MSFLTDILKVGGGIGQFIPGGQAIGFGASALGGLLESGDANKKKRKLTGNIQDQALSQQALGQQYQSLALPYLQQLLPSIMSSATNYDASSFIDPQYRQILENYGAQGDQGVNALYSDYASRGLGRDSSGFAAGASNIRGQQRAASTTALGNLAAQAEQQRQQRLNSALSAVTGVSQMGNQLQQQSLGTMGGLEGMYASESSGLDTALAGLGGIAGQVFGTGASSNRASNAGQSTLNTNNSGSLTIQPGNEMLPIKKKLKSPGLAPGAAQIRGV